MFVQGYVTVFLCLCELGERGPQRLLRLMAFLWGLVDVAEFVQEHVVLFLYLCELDSKESPQGYHV